MAAKSLVLFLCLVIALSLAARDLGVTWDESIYFEFSDRVRAWFAGGAPLDASSLAATFAYDPYHNPHPPLTKVLSALTSSIPGLPFPVNYRLATLLSGAALLALAFHLLATRYGALPGLSAVGFVLLQPRLFGHALIAATDSPVALAWMALALLAWRIAESTRPSERRGLRILLHVVYGWGVAAKFTGFLAMAPVILFFLWRRQLREVAWAAGGMLDGLAFLALTSPEMWHHPVSGVGAYLLYPLSRQSIPIGTFYLGHTYTSALPWHYLDVMTLITLPMLVLVFLPAAALVDQTRWPLLQSLLCSVAFWAVLGHLPGTPRHDGVRQFLALMPVLGLVAWVGVWSLVARLGRWRTALAGRAVRASIVGVLLLALGLGLRPWTIYPLCFYNALIGGLPGAERAGLEISYYLEVVNPSFLRRVNELLPPGRSLALFPVWPALLHRYQQEGLLRSDIPLAGGENPRAASVILVRRRSVVGDEAYERVRAAAETRVDGVSLVKLVIFSR